MTRTIQGITDFIVYNHNDMRPMEIAEMIIEATNLFLEAEEVYPIPASGSQKMRLAPCPAPTKEKAISSRVEFADEDDDDDDDDLEATTEMVVVWF